MRRGVVLAIVAVACAPTPVQHAPASPSRNESARSAPRATAASSHQYAHARRERPAIAAANLLPDYHEELRWPLPAASHPMLEPQFPIARELAINVGWEDLCARGVHRRTTPAQTEQLEYLRGWCRVLERDIDAACRHLKPLLRSSLRGMANAVQRDLANIFVGHGDADDVEGAITRCLIRDVRVLDLLAASYAEMGRLDDAFVINRLAVDADVAPSTATKCRRLAKTIVLTREPAARALPYEELRTYVQDVRTADPTCRQLVDAVTCTQAPWFTCAAYFAKHNLDARYIPVLQAYMAWPTEADHAVWWALGNRLRGSFDLRDAVELAVTAYEASVNAFALCNGLRAKTINDAIGAIRATSTNASFEPRLVELERACPWPPSAETVSTTATPTAPAKPPAAPRSVTSPVPAPRDPPPSNP